MKNRNILSLWLFTCTILVFLMVGVGGATRITHSGLSITEWKPIVGIFPPLNQESWKIEFEKYKQIPEFKLINHQMSLDDFKKIYFLEYFHRLLGRLIFLICIIPLFLFFIFKVINIKFFLKMLLIFSLIGIQGLVGWYMVKSGLIDRTSVNELWLASHLLFALLIFSLIFIEGLKIFFHYENSIFSKIKENKFLFFVTFILIPLQIFFGGLTAGIHILNFCYKNSHDICDFSFLQTVVYQSEMPFFYFHKLLAFALFFSIIYISYFYFSENKKIISSLLFFLIAQIILGIAVIFSPNNFAYINYIAVIHQLNGFLIGALAIYLSFMQNLNYAIKTEKL